MTEHTSEVCVRRNVPIRAIAFSGSGSPTESTRGEILFCARHDVVIATARIAGTQAIMEPGPRVNPEIRFGRQGQLRSCTMQYEQQSQTMCARPALSRLTLAQMMLTGVPPPRKVGCRATQRGELQPFPSSTVSRRNVFP